MVDGFETHGLRRDEQRQVIGPLDVRLAGSRDVGALEDQPRLGLVTHEHLARRRGDLGRGFLGCAFHCFRLGGRLGRLRFGSGDFGGRGFGGLGRRSRDRRFDRGHLDGLGDADGDGFGLRGRGLGGRHCQRLTHTFCVDLVDCRMGAALTSVELGERVEHPSAGGSQHASQRMNSQPLWESFLLRSLGG